MRILITAGPTYERIDPVRFIGNYSSGKMGMALVDECINRGHSVELILGPVCSPDFNLVQKGLRVTHVESAQDMYDACMSIFPDMDAAVLCAAVADFTPLTQSKTKIKRVGDELVVRLRPTQDIAASLGRIKKNNQILAGFALETDHEETNAKGKLQRKNFDFIVLNSLNDEGAGFRHDTNKITIIDSESETRLPLKTKCECAKDIIDCLEGCSINSTQMKD